MNLKKESIFLIKELECIIKKYKLTHVKYSYEKLSDFHIIEIEPKSIRIENKDYQMDEINIWDNFVKKFPSSNLLIDNPNNSYDMSNLIFEYKNDKTSK